MLDLDELQRLAEGAADECEVDSDWFDDELIESDELISSSRKARRLIAAMSPDTAKKLIAVARAGLVAHREVQRFKMRWLNLPPFADKLNKTTRQAMTTAHQPIMMAEEVLRAALEQLRSLPDPSATPQDQGGER